VANARELWQVCRTCRRYPRRARHDHRHNRRGLAGAPRRNQAAARQTCRRLRRRIGVAGAARRWSRAQRIFVALQFRASTTDRNRTPRLQLRLQMLPTHRVRRGYGTGHRYLPVLARARGFRVTEVPVTHGPRKHGRSRYGWARIIDGMLGIAAAIIAERFARKPGSFFGYVALATIAVGIVLFVLPIV